MEAARDRSIKRPQFNWVRMVSCALSILLMLAWLQGCASQKYATMRKVPANPLAGDLSLWSRSGPEISERTHALLRRYDLLDRYKTKPEQCLDDLQTLMDDEPASEKTYAVSELAYILGKRAEQVGKTAHALDMYSVAVSNAYIFLFSPNFDSYRNPYDPQFRGACDLYNSSLEATLRLVNKDGQLKPGSTYAVSTEEQTVNVKVVSMGNWHQEEFGKVEFCSNYKVDGLDTTNVTYGIGVPLIAVRALHQGADSAEDYYPNGLSFPVTALLVVKPNFDGGDKAAKHRYVCELQLHDSLAENDIQVAGRLVPLQTDLSTPLAYFLDNPEFREQTNSTRMLLNPNKSQNVRGIYMLEPFDPDRIPVLMVHGLWSSPLTWMPMFNDLRSFPSLRRNYQFWFYQYPTGQPFWVSSTQLRADLQALRDSLDPHHEVDKLDQMVLVGHSMGGLVSRMQTIESGDEFWRILSDEPFDKVNGKEIEIQNLRKALYFHPNKSIRRVVTIGTPLHGSNYANDYTRWISRKLIKLPTTLTDTGHSLARQNPNLFRDKELLTTNTSIDSLSPDSPIFPVMLRAPRAPWVTYHNIFGVVPETGFLNRFSQGSDGVVTIESAHADDAKTEIQVTAQHQDIHRTPKAILEVRRILQEHLDVVQAEDRVANRSQQIAMPDPNRQREHFIAPQVWQASTRKTESNSFAQPALPADRLSPHSSNLPRVHSAVNTQPATTTP